MEEKDLKQIREIVREEVEKGTEKAVTKGLLQFWEDNLEPAFNEIHDSIAVVEAKVNKALNIEYVRLEKRLKVVEQKLGITASAGNPD